MPQEIDMITIQYRIPLGKSLLISGLATHIYQEITSLYNCPTGDYFRRAPNVLLFVVLRVPSHRDIIGNQAGGCLYPILWFIYHEHHYIRNKILHCFEITLNPLFLKSVDFRWEELGMLHDILVITNAGLFQKLMKPSFSFSFCIYDLKV